MGFFLRKFCVDLRHIICICLKYYVPLQYQNNNKTYNTMKSTKEYTVSEVMMMAAANGGIMNKCRNKIEFNNGVVYAFDFYSKMYHKVHAVTL